MHRRSVQDTAGRAELRTVVSLMKVAAVPIGLRAGS